MALRAVVQYEEAPHRMPMDVRKFEFLCGVVDKMQKEMQKAAVTLENEQKISLMILLFRYSDKNGRDVDWEAISAMCRDSSRGNRR